MMWAMSGHKSREEWLQDIAERQRNTVFPDTVQNEARFWRTIFEGKQRLTRVQGIGVCVLVFMALVLLFTTLFLDGPSRGFSWANFIYGASRWLIAFAILGIFLLVFNVSQNWKRK
jgi:hypothetical protein